MYNELRTESTASRFLSFDKGTGKYIVKNTGDTPFFHHVALLKELKKVATSGQIYTYHFNILRNILEKTAAFHGFNDFSACIKREDDDWMMPPTNVCRSLRFIPLMQSRKPPAYCMQQ